MHEIFEDEGSVYLIMDMLNGCTLKELLKINKNVLKEESALIILEQILLSLDFMHSRGVILQLINTETIFINNISNEKQEFDVSISDLS
jgi:serine/threonine protein kinase